MSIAPRGLGWRRAHDKLRVDRPYDAAELLRADPVPASVDLGHLLPEHPLDQGGLGSCVANAIASAVRGSHVAQGLANPEHLARLALYYEARRMSNDQATDSGSYIHLAFAALNTLGFCRESLYPYTDQGDKWAHQPPISVMHAAIDQSAPALYRRIYSVGSKRVDDVKRALAQGFLVVFGTEVSVDFCRGKLGPDGVADVPRGEEIAGGHAMVWWGYDESDRFRTLTSWGENAFDRSRFLMSADYAADPSTEDVCIVERAPVYRVA